MSHTAPATDAAHPQSDAVGSPRPARKKPLRHRMVVNRSFQIRFIGRLILLKLAVVCITAAATAILAIFVFHSTTLRSGLWGDAFLFDLGAVLFALTLLVVWRAVVESHRIAGPLYRMEKVFVRVADGDLSLRAHVRTHDDLQPFVEQFNRMLHHLEQRARRQREWVEELHAVCRAGEPTRIEEALKRYEDVAYHCRAETPGACDAPDQARQPSQI